MDFTQIQSKKVSPHSDVFQEQRHISFCAGCGHGSLNIMLAEIIEELQIQKQTVMVTGVGCGSASGGLQRVDVVGTPHGRASDVCTGISRMLPEKTVVQYSGDGDSCAIGLAGLLHSCARQENFIVLIYNNNTYGMTGGQLGPTTSAVVPTTTFLSGRDKDIQGFPLDIIDLVTPLPGCVFAARERLTTGKNVFHAKRTLKKAFELHLSGVRGIKLIDFLGNCNVNWKGDRTFTPITANELIDEEVSKYFKLGVAKQPEAVGNQQPAIKSETRN